MNGHDFPEMFDSQDAAERAREEMEYQIEQAEAKLRADAEYNRLIDDRDWDEVSDE